MPKVNEGRENGLKLIIDVNSERETLLTLSRKDSLKIHINTIKPFTAYGGGQYIVTSVKEMTTTADFDILSEEVKRCQNEETIEECSNRKLMTGAAKQCGCLPGIVNYLQHLVKVTNKISSNVFYLQN